MELAVSIIEFVRISSVGTGPGLLLGGRFRSKIFQSSGLLFMGLMFQGIVDVVVCRQVTPTL